MSILLSKKRKDFEKHMMRHMFSTFLLWFISKKQIHGYQMIKQLEEEEGFKIITASQLYPILKDLMKQGLIAQKKEMQGQRARKVYTITEKGKAALFDAKKCMCEKPLKRAFLREMVE